MIPIFLPCVDNTSTRFLLIEFDARYFSWDKTFPKYFRMEDATMSNLDVKPKSENYKTFNQFIISPMRFVDIVW